MRETLGGWKKLEQSVFVSLPISSMPVKYGDELLLHGEVLRTTSKRNPGSFDAEFYLERVGIAARVFVNSPEDYLLISQGQGSRFLFNVGQLKGLLKDQIERIIPQPECGVVVALLLGDRENISFETQDYFSKSGTAHLIAISGLHVTLIASIFMIFLRAFQLSRRNSCWGTIVLLVIYAVLTGASASVLRSTIMILFFLGGYIIRRESEIITSLSWSAIFILVFQPLQIFDPGFQLSFLTVFFLGVMSPSFKLEADERDEHSGERTLFGLTLSRKWRWLFKFFCFIRQLLEVSFSAWISILPVVACYFYLINPVALLANLILVPYSGLVIAGGFVFLLLGNINGFLFETLGSCVWFLTKIFILICKFFAGLPYGWFRVPPPTLFDFLLFYSALLIFILRDSMKLSLLRYGAILFVFLNIFVCKNLAVSYFSPKNNLKITFLDVGHGDAALVQFPRGGCFLIDAGLGEPWDQGRLTIAPFLWSQGITRLDAILITHSDFDHCGGLNYILDEFSVGTVFDNGARDSPFYESCFNNREMRRARLGQGDRINFVDGVIMSVLHPTEDFVKKCLKDPNDQSVVVQICYGNVKTLMCGDARRMALESINSYGGKLRSDILKVSHHGSDEGVQGEMFISLVKPAIAVISEAEKNHYNLPSKKIVGFLKESGAELYQTGFSGAVECVTDGTTISVKKMF